MPVVLLSSEGNLRCCKLQVAPETHKSNVTGGQNKSIYRIKHGLSLVFYMGRSTWQGSIPSCLTVVKSHGVPLGQRRATEKWHFLPHTSALSCSEVIKGADDQHSMVSSLIVRKVKSSAQATLQQIHHVLQPSSVLHKEEGSSQSF